MEILGKDFIQRELSKINIPFDLKVIEEVEAFLAKFIGPLSQQDSQYNIPAACAIICETIKLPTVDNTTEVSTGIKIENVMRHVGNLSKEKFLETIELQLKKSGLLNYGLIEKVGHIKISFRVFKKYQNIFVKFRQSSKIPFNLENELLAFFWIIYLITKHNLSALENLVLSTKTLVLLIEEIFCTFYGPQNRENVRNFISEKNNFSELPFINPEEEALIKTEIHKLVNETIQNRESSETPNYANLLTNSVLLSRLVDDLNGKYERIFQNLPEGRFIDEMTYLELTRNLTPQAFVVKSNKKEISKVINFGTDDEDDDDDKDEMMDEVYTENKKPCFVELGSADKSINKNLFMSFSQPSTYNLKLRQSKSMSDLTPVSLGQTKNSWAQNFIAAYNEETTLFLEKYLQEKNLSFENLCTCTKEKVSIQVNTLTQYASNKEKTINEIVKMCFAFSFEILKKTPNYDIFNENHFNALLSISTALYNESVRILSLDLSRYCSIYKADLIDCLKVLYEIYEKANLPALINQILSEIEKQVLIKELWDTERGYKLLCEGRNENNESIFNRLERRIYERIKEICEANKVELGEAKKIEALIKEIIAKKSNLLSQNKLDQIIICSICACLNLNEAKYNLALSSIFNKYNTVSLSYHSNCEILSNVKEEGTPLTLLEFYNKFFVQEIHDMMRHEENPKYMYTPIRENHLKKMKEETKGFTPTSRFLSNPNSLPAFGQNPHNYQRQMLQKLKSSDRKEEDDCESPYFGTESQRKERKESLTSQGGKAPSLQRKITFGENQPN